jgi:hypothetical protein
MPLLDEELTVDNTNKPIHEELDEISSDIDKLFNKINWGSSFLGAPEVQIMNTLQPRLKALIEKTKPAL